MPNEPYTEFTLMHDGNVELLPGVLPLSDQDRVTDSALAAGLLGDQEIACKIISQKRVRLTGSRLVIIG